MSSYSRQQLEDFLKVVRVLDDTKVLDIGGSQLPIQKRIQSSKGVTFKIMDLEQPHETQVKPDYVFDIQSTEPISALGINRTFHVVFCIEVSEYWFDPLTALRNIHQTLKSGGNLFISFHFMYPLHMPTGKDYLRYTKYGAMKLLEEAGFKVVRYFPRKVRHVGTMLAFHRSEGFKSDKSETEDALSDSGCIIIAQKI